MLTTRLSSVRPLLLCHYLFSYQYLLTQGATGVKKRGVKKVSCIVQWYKLALRAIRNIDY